MSRSFYPPEEFAPSPSRVSLLPFRITRLQGQELLVNEAGEFLFAPTGTVVSLADGTIDVQSPLYKDLKAKHFLYDETSSPLLDVLATKIRTKHDHMRGDKSPHLCGDTSL